ncbi:hypothetical protein H2198_004053 [Neophaeococcomyces mojaviensis]|uniref:Uncharacterized protein n=1 Tax=Neophaeococcomyces mojaviensis TaxID=3383035 RepID=A0ACC3A9P2_9EURO|nr:hypothetical protein H2198_004053 [Knufia sp. JES_112]
MVKPWNEWMFIIFPEADWDPAIHGGEPTHDEYMQRVRDFIGDDKIPAKIVNISKWAVNEVVAERYSSDTGNIHCLGDAVHRHPPFNGLGSNTCIQDAYNLAWKVAYTLRGTANPRILTSYSIERQPVGLGVITRANQGFRDHLAVWQALGITEPDLESATKAFEELSAITPAGAKRRRAFRKAIEGTEKEFHAVGQEMNQKYDGSPAVCFKDEKDPRPPLPEDAVLNYQISTYPGSRLPHAWLNARVPGKQISTQDLVGKGRFTLLTGPGDGEGRWKAAAEKVGKELGIEVKSVSIGWRCDWEDVYFDWERKREVEEDGCVLIRPDRFVAWRSIGMVEEPEERLRRAMRGVLCLDA